MAEKLKASVMIAELRKHVGDGYVYGAVGQECTLALLQAKQRQYGTAMGNGYYQLNGDYNKGDCARWLGMWVADCSGLIKAMRKQLSGVWRDVSAQGTYDQCPVSQRGKIGTMPKVPGCTVYVWDAGKGRMGHVGMYIGGGLVIEARGVKYGVVITKLAGRAWTHWGMLDYLDHDLPQEGGQDAPVPVTPETDHGDNTTSKSDDLPVLRYNLLLSNTSSTDVQRLQRLLLLHDAKCLPRWGADGKFGTETLSAIKAFQRTHKDVYDRPLEIDGIVGVLTWGALLA